MKTKDQTNTEPTEPASTEFSRFRDFVKQVVSVPKEEIDKRQAEYEAKKKRGKFKP